MVITAERASESVSEAASAVSGWVSDAASRIAEPVVEAVEKVDLDAAKSFAEDQASTAADNAESAVGSLLGVAPVAALATRKALRRSTFLGLAVGGVFAWFFEPNKGKERRDKAAGVVKDAWASIAQRFDRQDVTTNPSVSNPNFNKS